MDEERFQKALAKLVEKLAKQLDPNKYQGEAVIDLLNQNEEDKKTVMGQVEQLGESGKLEAALMKIEAEEEGIPMQKLGGKLDYLQSLKKGGKMKKKCACGCDLVMKKEKGGKLIESCACGCKPKAKYEKGGSIQKLQSGKTISYYRGPHHTYGSQPLSATPHSGRSISWKDIGNTISDFVRYGDIDYVPKTQYWYNARMKSGIPIKTNKATVTQTPVPISNQVAPVLQQGKTVPTTATPTPSPDPTPVTVPVKSSVTTTAPNTDVSIVDYLNSMGEASDKTARRALAKKLGITNYNFSADSNKRLLQAKKAKDRSLPEEYSIPKAPIAPITTAAVQAPQSILPAKTIPQTPAVPGLKARQGFEKAPLTMEAYKRMFGPKLKI